MTKEKQKPQISPRGIAKYPHLDKTAVIQGTDTGKYEITLLVDPNDPDVELWLQKLEADMKKGAPKGKNLPFGDEIDKQTDKPTGLTEVTFKSAFKPTLFDSKGQRMSSDVRVGNGSIVRVSFTENWYPAFGGGMNLYLQGVQIIKLEEFQGRGFEDLGFQPEEGFEGDQPPEELTEKKEPDNWNVIHEILEEADLLAAETELDHEAIGKWFVEGQQSKIALVKRVKHELKNASIPF